MKKKRNYFKQVLAGILSFALVIETPAFVSAEELPPDEEIYLNEELSEVWEPAGDVLTGENDGCILSDNSVSVNGITETEAPVETELIPDEDMYSGAPDNDDPDTAVESEITGWHELTGYRSGNTKVYEGPDHSITAFCYASPVNYRDDSGAWRTIDNRLHYSGEAGDDVAGTGYYTNNSAPFDLRFAETADEDNLFLLKEGELAVSFAYSPKDVSLREEVPLGEAGDITVSEPEKGEGGEKDRWRRRAVLSRTGSARDRDILSKDTGGETVYDEEGSYPVLPNPQTVIYKSVDRDTSLEYIPTGDGVKETIVIASPEAPDTYTFRMKLKGMEAALDNGAVILSGASGEEMYEIPAPTVEDAQGNDDCAARYELKETGAGSYELKVVIDGAWLKGRGRAFPVRIDPTVRKYRRFSSLDQLGDFVCVCSDGTKDTQKLQVGHTGKDGKKKAVTYRTYMNPLLPDIDKGSVITDAKLRVSAHEAKKLFYLVSVPKKWDKDSISWANQPLNKGQNKYGSRNVRDFGKNNTAVLDITKDVRACAEGMGDACGWCIVSEDEKSNSVREVTPYKGTDKPFLEITYKDLTGTEDYYSVHGQSAGSAGNGYINDFTGRLTFVHTDASSAGDRMPFSISHVYDPAYGERMGEAKWHTGKDKGSAYGEHFRLSADVRLLVPAGEADVKKYPYVYIDADGTKHYFKASDVIYYVNGAKKTIEKRDDEEYPSAADEDGLGLFVVPVSESTLKDTYPLKIVNKSGSMSMYFDKSGYLARITDSNLREDKKNGFTGTAGDKKAENAITINYKNHEYDSTAEHKELEGIKEELKGIYDKNKGEDETVKEILACIDKLEKYERNSLNASVNHKIALHIRKGTESLEKICEGDKKGNYKSDIDTAVKELDKALGSDFSVTAKYPVSVKDASGATAELNYDDGRLVSMSDPYEGGALISYEYDNKGNLIRITHPNGIYAVFSYDKQGRLVRAADERGYRMDYAYGDKKHSSGRVTKVTEYYGRKAGQTVLISHDEPGVAVYTYSGNDEKINTKDDIENVYCFDKAGRTTGAYSRKKSTLDVMGGALRRYTDESDPEDAANKIKEEAFTGSQVINLISDGSFEKKKSKKGKEAWESFNTCTDTKSCHTVKKDDAKKYMGSKSAYVKLKEGHTGEAGYRQTVKVPEKGMYTASVYIRTKGLEYADASIRLTAKKKSSQSGEDTDSEEDGEEESGEGDDAENDPGSPEDGSDTDEEGSISSDTSPDINNGWRRIEATIKAGKGESVTITLSLKGRSGEAWFDCVQLEKGDLANQYNLLPSGGFEKGFIENPSLGGIPSGWAYGAEAVKAGEEATDDEDAYPDEKDDEESGSDADNSCVKIVTKKSTGGSVPEGKNALMITGSPIKRRSIIVNPNFGSEKASYTLSCYVRADCAPVPDKDSRRKCGIYIRGDNAGYNEDDASGKYRSLSGSPAAKALINTQVQGWQYVSVALPVKNWHGRLIEIRFDYEIGTLCIDGVMLAKNEVQTKTYTKSGKLKTSQKGERSTAYTIDGRGRRKKEKSSGGASTAYTYDKVTNDLTKEKHSFRQPGRDNATSLTTKYTYDEYGNVTEISEKSSGNDNTVVTGYGYDESGRFAVTETDSRGNTTKYRYDDNNGLLTGMTDALGMETEYSYNVFHHPEAVSEAGNNVSYSYDRKYHDRLKSINTGGSSGTTYSYSYDAYGNVTKVTRSGSDRKLVSYKYMRKNGKLAQTKYGNGNKVSYKYNDREQLVSKSYGGKDVISYEYDNRGNTARVTDKANALKYRYYYDDHGRITTASVMKAGSGGKDKDTELAAFQSIYDKAGRESVFAYYTDGKTYRTEFGYTSDDKAAAATLPTGGTFRRTYDGFDRVTKDAFTPQDKPETGEKKARGGGAAVNTAYTYLDTDRGEGSGKTKYTTRLLSKLDTTVGTGKNKKTAVSDCLDYDKLGRIDGFNGIVYTYDEPGRLIKAEDKNNDRVWEYSYDAAGNLTGSSYTGKGEKKEETYGYNKGNLTEFNGKKIGSYKGGNPKKYLGNTLKWERGRQLKSIKAGKDTGKQSAEYTYAYDGSRLSKTVGDKKDKTKTEYILNGSLILQERITGSGEEEVLNYYYSPDGRLLEIGYRKGDEKEDHYSVIRNALGDVVALYTAEGKLVGTYEYDPYGKLISETKNPAYDDTDGILAKNPFRYRGYYYDRETGWYYLQSRYYDPEVKRFINADSTDLLTNDCDNMMQYNLFMYCNGDPVNGVDPSGHIAIEYLVVGGFIITGVVLTGAIAINYSHSDSRSKFEAYIRSRISSIGDDQDPCDQYVYVLRDNKNIQEDGKGLPMYVGRTKDPDTRKAAHRQDSNRKNLEMDILEKNLTKKEARGYEQAIMMALDTKRIENKIGNQINGISHSNPNALDYFIAAFIHSEGDYDYFSNQICELILNWKECNW